MERASATMSSNGRLRSGPRLNGTMQYVHVFSNPYTIGIQYERVEERATRFSARAVTREAASRSAALTGRPPSTVGAAGGRGGARVGAWAEKRPGRGPGWGPSPAQRNMSRPEKRRDSPSGWDPRTPQPVRT